MPIIWAKSRKLIYIYLDLSWNHKPENINFISFRQGEPVLNPKFTASKPSGSAINQALAEVPDLISSRDGFSTTFSSVQPGGTKEDKTWTRSVDHVLNL